MDLDVNSSARSRRKVIWRNSCRKQSLRLAMRLIFVWKLHVQRFILFLCYRLSTSSNAEFVYFMWNHNGLYSTYLGAVFDAITIIYSCSRDIQSHWTRPMFDFVTRQGVGQHQSSSSEQSCDYKTTKLTIQPEAHTVVSRRSQNSSNFRALNCRSSHISLKYNVNADQRVTYDYASIIHSDSLCCLLPRDVDDGWVLSLWCEII